MSSQSAKNLGKFRTRTQRVHAPVQTIGHIGAATGGIAVLRNPEGDNVIVRFQIGRDFDQADHPAAPVTLWLDHQAGTQFVMGARV